MNAQHLRAFFWLRWRLLVNQLKRGGTVNAVLLALLAAGAVLLGSLLAVVFFLVGLFRLAQTSPAVHMYVWDGLVATFLMFWLIGLMAELQRAEALSLEKFLHLPVSVTGVFLLNYLSSLFRLSFILLLPAMVGLSLGLAFGRGPAMLLLLPLLAGFLLMVTAVTYQFQGWLASLMVNKRRRRTVIFLMTAVFILVFQLPNLLNIFQPWDEKTGATAGSLQAKRAELQRDLAAGKITNLHFQQRQNEIFKEFEEQHRQASQQMERTVRFANLVLPPGWLPLGAMTLAEGDVLPALLGTLGLALIGTASLWRAYRTTVRLYTGQYTAGVKSQKSEVRSQESGVRSQESGVKSQATRLVERELPWVSEHAAAIAVAGLRSLMRAPEAKMMLLTPVLMIVVFGGVFIRGSMDPSEAVRPLLGFAGMAMVLLSMVQLLGNQFGFDRGGFRVFVLCPARRQDILLGKNLAMVPLAVVLCLAAAAFVQLCYPMRFDHFLALLPQFVAMYLLFCMLSNLLSILAPMPIASGSLRRTNTKVIPMLLHLAFVFLFPLALGPVLLPLGIEVVLESAGWIGGVPVCLLLSLVECVAAGYLYRLAVSWQGNLLQAREQRILEIVASKAE